MKCLIQFVVFTLTTHVGFCQDNSTLSKQVFRGRRDVFELTSGETCDYHDAKPYTNNDLPSNRTLCQCQQVWGTLVFDLDMLDMCYDASYLTFEDTTLLYVKGFDPQVYTIYWANSTWQTNDFLVINDNETNFDICTSSFDTPIFYEQRHYELEWNQYPLDVLLQKKNTNDLRFEVNPALVQNRRRLQGRLFIVELECLMNKKTYLVAFKFSGRREYVFPNTTTPTATPAVNSTIAQTTTTSTGSTITYQTILTTEHTTPTTPYPTPPTPHTTEETTESITSATVFRNINGDEYGTSQETIRCNTSPNFHTYMVKAYNNGVGCSSVYDIENTYDSFYNRMVYISGQTTIYTLQYITTNKAWKQHADKNIVIRNGTNLKSISACKDASHIQIKSIFIFTLIGWRRWAGLNEDYFKLVRTSMDTYHIQFTYEKYFDDFVGHLLDVRMECNGSPIYHLFIKFEGKREYNENDDFSLLKPTKRVTTRGPVTQKTTTKIIGPPPSDKSESKNQTGLIVGVVIAAVVLAVLVIVVLICVVKPRLERKRQLRKYGSQSPSNKYSTTPWTKTANSSLHVPEDPKQKEAEEIIELAKEIINERKSMGNKPDVIPTYIKNRPAPTYHDPRPAIGPLSQDGHYDIPDPNDNTEGYAKLKMDNRYLPGDYVDMNGNEGGEGAYLDLDNVQDTYYQELEKETIEPDENC